MRCLLIDKITGYTEGLNIRGIKNVTMSENFLQDHFPGFPVMPGVLQLEAVLQLASWLVFATTGFSKKARLVSLKSVKYRAFVVPGDQMQITLECTDWDESQAVFDASVCVEGKLKTKITGGCLSFVDVDTLEDPLKAKELFDFITGKDPRGGYRSGRGTLL